jgi:hypothetical protein
MWKSLTSEDPGSDRLKFNISFFFNQNYPGKHSVIFLKFEKLIQLNVFQLVTLHSTKYL